jgi:RES domain-containing protein
LKFYRISNHTDLLGLGGELADGRWHTRGPGKRIVYTSEHPALCILETLVHIGPLDEIPATYQLVEIDVPDAYIDEEIDPAVLKEQSIRGTRSIGDGWLESQRCGACLVPSAVVPYSWNCILNPRFAGIADLKVEVLGRFPYDARLFR